jgi:DNA-binding MarR family transcriptional regulator
VRVRVTPLGRSLEARLHAFHERIVETAQRDLSDGEVQMAKVVLAKIIQTLRSAGA